MFKERGDSGTLYEVDNKGRRRVPFGESGCPTVGRHPITRKVGVEPTYAAWDNHLSIGCHILADHAGLEPAYPGQIQVAVPNKPNDPFNLGGESRNRTQTPRGVESLSKRSQSQTESFSKLVPCTGLEPVYSHL